MALSRAAWRKASRGTADGDDCIEVAWVSNVVAIRGSKAPSGPVLLLTRAPCERPSKPPTPTDTYRYPLTTRHHPRRRSHPSNPRGVPDQVDASADRPDHVARSV